MRNFNARDLVPSTVKRLEALERQGAAGANWDMYYFDSDSASQVFYDRDFITRKWSRWMRLVTYEPQFHNYQSAMLLKKAPQP